MKHFQQELAPLKQRVRRHGQPRRIHGRRRVSSRYQRPTAAAIQQVRANEPTLDRFQVEIDREAIRLMTIYAPVAKDLRFLLMIARINSELERIGDQAVDNCEYVEAPHRSRSPRSMMCHICRRSS